MEPPPVGGLVAPRQGAPTPPKVSGETRHLGPRPGPRGPAATATAVHAGPRRAWALLPSAGKNHDPQPADQTVPGRPRQGVREGRPQQRSQPPHNRTGRCLEAGEDPRLPSRGDGPGRAPSGPSTARQDRTWVRSCVAGEGPHPRGAAVGGEGPRPPWGGRVPLRSGQRHSVRVSAGHNRSAGRCTGHAALGPILATQQGFWLTGVHCTGLAAN